MDSSGFHTRHLAIIGLGLMGGSMAQALRKRADFITGIELNAESREYALQQGIIDTATDNVQEGVAEADVVVLAIPVRACIELIDKRLGSYLRSNTLVIDIGSTKKDICNVMGQLPIGINAIGGHPMTGKETSGIHFSEPTLYKNRPFVLCETRRTTPATTRRAINFAKALGAIPIEMDAMVHDHIVAAISHLPYLLSATLVATVQQESQQFEDVWKLAAGGFRDTSRLAGSDINMMGDILSTNTQAVATLLAMFRMQLAILETQLIAGNHEELLEMLKTIRQSRLDWGENFL